MKNSIEVTLGDQLNELHKLVETVEEFGNLHALPKNVCYNLHLVCEELFVNFVNHSDSENTHKKITIKLSIADSDLLIIMRDNGKPFDPLSTPLPDISKGLDERTIGGLGVFLVRQWADDISYEYLDNANVLTIKKRL